MNQKDQSQNPLRIQRSKKMTSSIPSMVYAKKPEGESMLDSTENNIEETDDLRPFNKDMYTFDTKLSNEKTFIFKT